MRAISVVAGSWAWPDDEETVEPSDEECSSSWKNASTFRGFSSGWTGSTGSMMGMGEGEGSGDGGSGKKTGSEISETGSGHMFSSLWFSFSGLIGTRSNCCAMAGDTGVATSIIGE